jgi:hypothetical protein
MDQDASAESGMDTESILKCLADCVHGRGELSATQIRAAEILLRRAAQDEAPAASSERAPVTEIRNVLVRPRA